MIDDITLAGRFSQPVENFEPSFTVRKQASGVLMGDWGAVSGRGFIMMIAPDSLNFEIKFSVPRLINHSGINWPLHPVQGLHLGGVVRELLAWLAQPVNPRNIALLLDILTRQSVVRRIAYALDIQVEDVHGTIMALHEGVQGRVPKLWGKPASGFEIESAGTRLMVYDKAKEIRVRARRGSSDQHYSRPDRATLRGASEEARNTLRIEVTLTNAEAVRKFSAAPAGLLPNMGWVIQDEVGAYAILKQLRLLGLYKEDIKVDDKVEFASVVRALVVAIRGRGYARGGREARGSAILNAAGVYLLQQTMDNRQIRELLSMSESSLYWHRRLLRQAGLFFKPSESRAVANLQRGITEAVGPDLPEWMMLSEPTASDLIRTPWS